jgi:hypothetical protein
MTPLNAPRLGDFRHRISFYDAAGAPEAVNLTTPTVRLTHQSTGATVTLTVGAGLEKPVDAANAIDISIDKATKNDWAKGSWLADLVLAWPSGLDDAAVSFTIQVSETGAGGVAGTKVYRQPDGTRVIRSSDGMGSLGEAYVSMTERLSAEEVTRALADTSLTTRLSAEETVRSTAISAAHSADASLTERLSAEEAAGDVADASLTSRLSAEEVTRAVADTSLTTRLSTEEATRSSAISAANSADASLTERLSAEEAAGDVADASLTSRISSEEASRATADGSLTTRLSTEEVARAAGDVSLTSRLSGEEGSRAAADASLTTRLSTEEAARAADTGGKVSKAGDIMAGVLAFILGTAALPGIAFAGDLDTGLYSPAADTVAITAGGVEALRASAGLVTVSGGLRADADGLRDLGTAAVGWRNAYARSYRFTDNDLISTSSGYLNFRVNGVDRAAIGPSAQVQLRSDGAFSWSSTASPVGTADLWLFRDAPNTLALRNGANAQGLRVYNTYADASNYERLSFDYSGGNFRIMSQAAGTGSNRSLSLGTANTERWFISGASGHFIPNADSAYDLASPANRVRDGWFSRNVSAGGTLSVTGAASIQGLTVGLGNNGVSSNTAVGVGVLAAVGAGVSNNTGVGKDALNALVSGGGYNTAVGAGAAPRLTSGNDNTVVGGAALNQATSATSCVAIGAYAMSQATTAASNVAVGTSALSNNTTGSTMVAVGHQALRSATAEVATFGAITGGAGYVDGTYLNVQLTYVSGATMVTYPRADIVVSGGAVTSLALTSGGVGARDTTTVLTAPAASLGGSGAGFQVQPATFLVAGGNTAVGFQASWSTTTAQNGVSLGFQALYSATSGARNTALGSTALYALTTGHNNTAVGFRALYFTTTGGDNVALGRDALYNNTTGAGNIAIGYGADIARTAGSYNIAIGHNVSCDNSTLTGEINIGNRYYHDRIALSGDGIIRRVAANTLAMRNGLSPQAMQWFETYTDPSNYARISLSVAGTVWSLLTEAAGSGSIRDLRIGAGTGGGLYLRAGNADRWAVFSTGTLNPGVTNSYDLGSTSFTVRTGYFGTSVITPYVRTTPTTVAALPAASTAGAGAKAHVTDATSTTFASPVAGGGANSVPVYSDGTQWLIG